MSKSQLATAVLGAALLLPILLAPVLRDEPRLIGWGCEGAGVEPMFGNEESDFPLCREIKEFSK